MDVGNGHKISDKWIPEGVATGLLDTEGSLIHTGNTVRLSGCTSETAVIGVNRKGEFMLYFGGKDGSVGWHLTEKVIRKNKVTLKK